MTEAHLRVEVGAAPGALFTIAPGRTAWIGSDPSVEITLCDLGIAPRHAAVRFDGETLRVVDLGSPGGTFLEEARLSPHTSAELRGGDGLGLGGHLLRVNLLGAAPRARRTVRLSGRPRDGIPRDVFEVEGQIGQGASGRVYAAKRRADGRRVAIKVLNDDLTPGSKEHERFVREGAIGGRLDHPNVVTVFERGVHDGRAFIVMELVDGPSLRDRLASGPLTLAFTLGVALDVAEAIGHAAERGIVHRDIKPANVVLRPDGRAQLTDFGIAKDLDASIRSLTETGEGLGTLTYMPPEQVSEAKHVDSRADLYSLGATVYHCLAGQPPFRITTPESVFQILQVPAPDLREARPDCPDALAELTARLLAKEPEERPAPWQVPDALRALAGR